MFYESGKREGEKDPRVKLLNVLRCLGSCTSRFRRSFFPEPVTLLNSIPQRLALLHSLWPRGFYTLYFMLFRLLLIILYIQPTVLFCLYYTLNLYTPLSISVYFISMYNIYIYGGLPVFFSGKGVVRLEYANTEELKGQIGRKLTLVLDYCSSRKCCFFP